MAEEEEKDPTKMDNLSSSVFDSKTPSDVIQGWNDRRKANNQIISSMTPFVQLIGIFNESEYEKMFMGTDEEGNSVERRAVAYTDVNGGEDALTSLNTPEAKQKTDRMIQWIEDELKSRFINLYIAEARESNEQSYLAVTPQDGIIMAEAVSQTKDFTGGIGITDLQVDAGKGAKSLTIRMTVNDPKLLNEKPEYSKMSTLLGEFLVIYGWTNPKIVEGFDNTSPPRLEADPSDSQKLMMRIPIGAIDTGGYWAAERMNITGYDFSFNEMGQLEVSLKLMNKSHMYLATTRLSAIANTWRKIMGTYDYDSGKVGAAEGGFTKLRVTGKNGESQTMVDLALAEQASYFQQDGSSTQTYLSDVGSIADDFGAKSLSEALSALSAESTPYSGKASDQQVEALIRGRKETESLGYPYAPGVSMYERVTRYVPIDTDDGVVVDYYEGDPKTDTVGEMAEDVDEEIVTTVATKPVSDYRTKVVYYYLGWVMDGIKLSLSDMNRGSTVTGERKITPKFAYLDNSSDSNITSAFQSQVRRSNSTGINERIQNAIIRLKEKCMPPWEGSRPNLRYNKSLLGVSEEAIVIKENYFPCRGQSLFDGEQTSNNRLMARALFPTPVGAPIELPHRGHIVTVDFRGTDAANWLQILESYDEAHPGTNLKGIAENTGRMNFFVPDWYQYVKPDDDGGPVPSGGSLEGFDPFNPTQYKAADRGGKFFYLVAFEAYTPTAQSGNTSSFTVPTKYQKIIEVDAYRQSSREIWNLTQRKWHNMYIEYLGNYFEAVIRKRMAELEAEGKTVEDIYDEPVDLDFLTSKQYRNARFMRSYDSVGGRFGGDEGVTDIPDLPEIKELKIDEDLLETISRAEDRVPSLQAQKVDVEDSQFRLDMIIRSKVANIKRLQSVEGTTILDGENAGIEQLTGGRYSRSAFNSDGTDRLNVRMGVEYNRPGTSDFFGSIISRSNYGYGGTPTGFDPARNAVYSGFNNFSRNIRGSYLPQFDEYETVIELDNSSTTQSPVVDEKYIMFVFFGQRTDNFKKNDTDDGNEQSRFQDEGSDRMKSDLEKAVEQAQNHVNRKLAQITRIQSELEPLYMRFENYNQTLIIIDEQLAGIERNLETYSRFMTEDGKQKPLSLYEDTSEFDDTLEIDMGREQPMRLETKVAQQWYRMFSGIVQRGATDVTNYGPAKGGTTYFPPSNTKAFRKESSRVGKDIVGYPKIVLDPIEYQKIVPGGLPSPLNLEESAVRERGGVGVIPKVYLNWSLFGEPVAPESPEAVNDGANTYGFITGPRVEEIDAEGNVVESSGGNYVKDYQDFLNIFNVQTDPSLPGEFNIRGTWPQRESTNVNGQTVYIPYYMIDDADNIIVEGTGEREGWFEQSGWFLGDGGLPVYLYPSREMATQIDPTNTTTAMPYGVPTGEYGFTDVDTRPMGMGGDGVGDGGNHWDEKGRRGQRNNLTNQLGRKHDTRKKSPTGLTKSRAEWKTDWDHLPEGGTSPLMNVGTPTNPILSNTYPPAIRNTVNTGEGPADFTSYGARIGRGEHCMNLTIGMKRALVIKRKNYYGAPSHTAETRKVFFSLGDDDPNMVAGSPGSAGASKVDWDQLTYEVNIRGEKKVFDFRVVKNDQNAGTSKMIPVYAMPGSSIASVNAYEGYPNLRPRRGATVQGPRIPKRNGFSNQYYPYGTGVYQKPSKQYGSASFPEKKPNKNWLYIGDFLDRLPGRGFFTRINNKNYSPTSLLPDGTIVDGEELNMGFIKFVIQNVLAPLPKNRRIGSRSGDSIPRGAVKVINAKWLGDHDEWRIQDVTYGHLFRPEDEDKEDLSGTDRHMADLSNLVIDNAGDIPIRRDVIDNLMNKQNANMSILQFMQEIMRPESIGINGKNINVGMRARSDGVMEVFQASKNWRNVAKEMHEDSEAALLKSRYPERHLLFDYKANDSLIERIDMNSKFDPGLSMTFELGARAFAGNPDKFAQFLSFGNIAVELREFLKQEDPELADIIQIKDDKAMGEAGRVSFAKSAFFSDAATGDQKTVPASLVTKFLMQNPERMAKLNAMLGSEPGSNFATQLLSNYMRKTTITIHGTTNIIPYNTIHVRGVLPDLEGMYLVTNTRESITPSGFQTIIEATLIQNLTLDPETGQPKSTANL